MLFNNALTGTLAKPYKHEPAPLMSLQVDDDILIGNQLADQHYKKISPLSGAKDKVEGSTLLEILTLFE